jgi:hypothetical protein
MPLDIKDYEWKHDGAGNTWGMDGLWIQAADLMKVGQMLCNFGEWNGKRILSQRWCEMMFQMPLVRAIKGEYGYAMSILSLPFGEEVSISPKTVDTLNALGLPEPFIQKLKILHSRDHYKYLELGEKLKDIFTSLEMEEISAFASRNMVPLLTVNNGNFYIKHGGEYGLLLTAYPKQQKVVVRYLGEKWGRQEKEGGGYKYIIESEIIRYMIKL